MLWSPPEDMVLLSICSLTCQHTRKLCGQHDGRSVFPSPSPEEARYSFLQLGVTTASGGFEPQTATIV